MIARLLMLVTLLLPCVVYSADPTADLSVNVVPHGSAPPTPPAAAAAGYGTLAFDGDMAKGFNVGCSETPDHDWYVTTNRTLGGSCGNLTYPYNDNGQTVLNIEWSPESRGGLLGRTGVTTVSQYATYGHDFPINAYYECVVRMTPLKSMGPWFNCFMGNRWAIGDTAGHLDNEYDLTEFHGGYPDNQEVGGSINWNCGKVFTSTCYWGGAFFGNIATKVPGFDPEQYHKYGYLLQQTSATNIHGCSYVDDIQLSCGDTSLDSREQDQRNLLILDISNACDFDEGAYECMNESINGVQDDGVGNTQVLVGWDVYVRAWRISISGVQGATNANGVFKWWPDQPDGSCFPNCSFHIYNENVEPIKYGPAPYVSGTGVLNPFTHSNMMVKSFRVWSCPDWATKECSQFNPH